MSQAIVLPKNVFGPNMAAIAEDYAREVALVAIILSDNYMKELYEKQDIGYIACLDILHEWAVEYVEKFAHVEEWEEFLSTDRTYGECVCWDDFVISFGQTKLIKYPF
jgi:hypothetical protein